jgi:hypothetical protein
VRGRAANIIILQRSHESFGNPLDETRQIGFLSPAALSITAEMPRNDWCARNTVLR